VAARATRCARERRVRSVMKLSIRARLTLWYSVVLGGVLVVSGYALLVAQAQIGLRRLDAELARINRPIGSGMSNELDEQQDVANALRAAAEDTREGVAVPGWTMAIADESGRVLDGTWALLRREDLHEADIGPWRAGEGEARTIVAPVGECRIWRESI